MLTDITDIISKETKQLPDNLLREVLDFVLFLKSKNKISDSKTDKDALVALQEDELKHLEQEFKDYNLIPE